MITIIFKDGPKMTINIDTNGIVASLAKETAVAAQATAVQAQKDAEAARDETKELLNAISYTIDGGTATNGGSVHV